MIHRFYDPYEILLVRRIYNDKKGRFSFIESIEIESIE